VDSKPLANVSQGKNLRFIARMSKTRLYTKYSSGPRVSSYKSNEEIAVRNFLKGLFSTPPMYNLHRKELVSYPLVLEFLQGYNSKLKYSESRLAIIKHRLNNTRRVPLQKTKESEEFVKYIHTKFKDFDEEAFYG